MGADQPEFIEVLLRTVVLGVAAFGLSGAALALFVRSLHRDTRSEDRSWSRSTILWLVVTVVSLLVFSLYFVWLAFS